MMKEIFHYLHLWHKAHEDMERNQGNSSAKLTAIALIVVGFGLAPFIVGIPMMIYGFIKLLE